jgi:hypothetical protein
VTATKDTKFVATKDAKFTKDVHGVWAVPESVECVATDVIGAAIEVHKHLGAATRIDLAHEAKVISYLRTTGLRLGLLLRFNCRTMKEGIKRIVV